MPPGQVRILAVLALSLTTACPSAGGAARAVARPTSGQGGDAHVEVACVLVPDGGLCTFTALGRAGTRCVKVLYGVASGTVVTSDDLCSGPLAPGASATLVVRFQTRPGDVCGRVMGDCQSRAVAPAGAQDVAIAWQGELEQDFSGPLSEADCKSLSEHKYEIYTHADCDGIADPVQRDGCYRNVRDERDREMPYLVEDCLQYFKRPRYSCEIKAKDQGELYACENQFPY